MHTLEVECPKTHRVSPSENIEALLVACYEAEHVFWQATQSTPYNQFRECVGKVRQLLHEFGFQLWTELQRIEGGRPSRFPTSGGCQHPNCESSLRRLLETYDCVLSFHLPPRTGAMVRRQYGQLQQRSDELTHFVHLLNALINTEEQVRVVGGL